MEDFELTLLDRVNAIRDTIAKFGEGNFYISFSGGKDSTIVSRLVDMAMPGNAIPRVFINTGIEYNAIVAFVRSKIAEDPRFAEIKPIKPITAMLKENGYPFKSKEHSHKLGIFQKRGMTNCVKAYLEGKKCSGKESKFVCPNVLRYQFSGAAGLKVSELCCRELKKRPAHAYERSSGRRIPILGLRMDEGGERANHPGCAVFDSRGRLTRFKPLNPVSDDFENWVVDKLAIRLCDLYYPPFDFKRTGCKGCPFAIDLERQLETMERLMPAEAKQCEMIWKPVYEEYRRIGYRLHKNTQTRLF